MVGAGVGARIAARMLDNSLRISYFYLPKTRVMFDRQLKQVIILFGLIILGSYLLWQMRGFFSGILGATALSLVLYTPQQWLVQKHRWRSWLAAAVLMLAITVVIIIPFFFTISMLIGKLAQIDLHSNELANGLAIATEKIQHYTNIDIKSTSITQRLTDIASRVVQGIISTTYNLGFNVVMLYFFLYFMVAKGEQIRQWFLDSLPFNPTNRRLLVSNMYKQTYSMVISIPIIALMQGIALTVGFAIFGVNDPIFWGIIGGIFSVVPYVGVAIIWIPLAIVVAASGNLGDAIGLAIYNLAVTSNIDNLFRMVFQKRMAKMSPFVTLVGLIIGINIFGFMGIIYGPILFSAFLVLVSIYNNEYRDMPPATNHDDCR